MDYNNIILELLDRIKIVENKVSNLENRLNNIIGNNKETATSIDNNTSGEDSLSEIGDYEDGNSINKYQFKNDMLGGDKYIRFTNYLKSSNKNTIELSFSDIESILGFSLNASTRKYRANWSNTTTISFPCSWIKAGYKVSFVDMANEKVEFVKNSSKQDSVDYPNTGEKYFRLTNYLRETGLSYIKLSFKEIEDILGFDLASSARVHQAFWSNTRSHSIACAWLDAGYKNINTNLTREFVEFRKL